MQKTAESVQEIKTYTGLRRKTLVEAIGGTWFSKRWSELRPWRKETEATERIGFAPLADGVQVRKSQDDWLKVTGDVLQEIMDEYAVMRLAG